ncbi:hypothetical protein K449DRAFT_452085 [Hypoxylon sp. EC38]|nr:hypothetical protein K449DRAFT_452085 [Hypoxylon sp. EC38]
MLSRALITSLVALLGSAAAMPSPADFIAGPGIEIKLDYVPHEQGIEAVDISNATIHARDNIFFQGTFWENKNEGGASYNWGMPSIGAGYYLKDGWNDRVSSLYQAYGPAITGDGYLCCRWVRFGSRLNTLRKYNDYDGSKCYGSSLTVTGKGYINYVGDAQNDQISCGACWNYQGFC